MFKIISELVYQNCNIELVNNACKLCYKSKPEIGLENKLKYIQGKIKAGHESVTEHSNIIILLTIVEPDINVLFQLSEVISSTNYVNSEIKKSKNNKEIYYVLLSGNIRAFKDIYRNIKNQDNIIAKELLEALYQLPKAYFYDFIQYGIMEISRFEDDDIIYSRQESIHHDPIVLENSIIENIDNISIIKNDINIRINEELFDINDLLRSCTTTILFTNISRVISQMYTRHRNPISQKSQRYVDEEGCNTNNPLKYIDRNSKEVFHTILGDLDLDQLSDRINYIYKELRRQGLKKQDARYLLTQNVHTDFYMTFTFKNLLHFLELRISEAVQPEMRKNVLSLYKFFNNKFKNSIGDNIFYYNIPEFVKNDIKQNSNEEIYSELEDDSNDNILEEQLELFEKYNRE